MKLAPSLLLILLVLAPIGCDESDTNSASAPLSASASAPESESAERPPAPPPPAHPPSEAVKRLNRGIDLSVHSGHVDWTQVAAAGHGFAIMKATEGVDLEDGAFADHWLRAAEVGLVRGAYHFYVTEDDPHGQADFFIAKVHLQPGDLAPIIDIELIGHHTEDGWQQNLVTFAQRLHEHYGVTPIFYTSPKFWSDHFEGEIAETLATYPLWIAEYGVDEPSVPASWPTWHIWQYEGDAPVAGVEKGADLSHVNRDEVDPAVLLVPEKAPVR